MRVRDRDVHGQFLYCTPDFFKPYAQSKRASDAAVQVSVAPCPVNLRRVGSLFLRQATRGNRAEPDITSHDPRDKLL